jgi:integrase
MPYTRAEFQALLSACDDPRRGESEHARANRRRLKSLLLVLRYSGLRISDALHLTAEKLSGGRVLLYMQKTRVPVYVPLPAWVLEQLEITPHLYGQFWWWGGRASTDCQAEIWRRRLQAAAAIAGVASPGWHRFRDTFAVEMLLAGVGIERVSVLLGHTSIRITERHYSPWVVARQQALDAEVAAAWAQDPIHRNFELRRLCDAAPEEALN